MSVLQARIRALHFAITIRLLNPQLGTVPFDQGVVEKYLEAKKFDHQKKYGNLTEAELEEAESKAVDEMEDKSWTGFHRACDLPEDDENYNRHFIYNYMVKGNLRYAAQVNNGSTYEVNGKEKKFPNNFKSKVTNAVFVSPRRIYLPLAEDLDLVPHVDEDGKATGFMRMRDSLERPLRCGGFPERTALARSDYLPAGATLDFQITLMGITGTNKVSRLDLEGILSFGERNGLGQWRNAGFGAFEVIHFEEIDEADAHDISEHGGGVVSA